MSQRVINLNMRKTMSLKVMNLNMKKAMSLQGNRNIKKVNKSSLASGYE